MKSTVASISLRVPYILKFANVKDVLQFEHDLRILLGCQSTHCAFLQSAEYAKLKFEVLHAISCAKKETNPPNVLTNEEGNGLLCHDETCLDNDNNNEDNKKQVLERGKRIGRGENGTSTSILYIPGSTLCVHVTSDRLQLIIQPRTSIGLIEQKERKNESMYAKTADENKIHHNHDHKDDGSDTSHTPVMIMNNTQKEEYYIVAKDENDEEMAYEEDKVISPSDIEYTTCKNSKTNNNKKKDVCNNNNKRKKKNKFAVVASNKRSKHENKMEEDIETVLEDQRNDEAAAKEECLRLEAREKLLLLSMTKSSCLASSSVCEIKTE